MLLASSRCIRVGCGTPVVLLTALSRPVAGFKGTSRREVGIEGMEVRERDTEKLGRVGPLKSGMDRRQRIKTKGSLTVHEPNYTELT